MQLIEWALLGNTASIGYHWVYDHHYLKQLASEKELLFSAPNRGEYTKAKHAFFVYPDAKVGTVSVQGEVIKWLYEALKSDSELSAESYRKLLLEAFSPGGHYRGYVESYGRKLVFESLAQSLKQPVTVHHNDDQLIGFAPYLAVKALRLKPNRAWELARLLTDRPIYPVLYRWLDYILEQGALENKQALLTQSLEQLEGYQISRFKAALDMTDTAAFIDEHVNTACHIDHALPLILHIVYHTDTFAEAVALNTVVGGASADRGALIGVLAGHFSPPPQSWSKYLTRT